MKIKLRIHDLVQCVLIACIGSTAIYNVKVAGHAISYYLYLIFIIFAAVEMISVKKLILSKEQPSSSLAFIGLMLISAVWMHPSNAAESNFSTFYICALLIIFSTLYNVDIKCMERIKILSLVVCVGLSIYMLYGNGSGLRHNGRMYLIIGGANVETNHLNFLFIFPVAYCVENIASHRISLLRKLILCAAVGLMCFVVVSTGSRGGILAIILTICVTFFFSDIKGGKVGAVVWTVLIAAFVVVFLYPYIQQFLPTQVAARINLTSLMQDGGNGRTGIWQEAIETIFGETNILYVLFGHGFLSSIADFGNTLHNVFIEIWYDQGFVGLGLYLVFNVKVLITAYRTKDAQALGLAIGQIALSLTLASVITRYFWINYLLIILYYKMDVQKNKRIIHE